MHWNSNARVFNLRRSGTSWESIEDFNNAKGSTMLITLTDESMYDRYEPGDTVQIKVSDEFPDNSDCLISIDDEVSFRRIAQDPDDEDMISVIRTWPARSKKVKKEDITILGYATGILRT